MGFYYIMNIKSHPTSNGYHDLFLLSKNLTPQEQDHLEQVNIDYNKGLITERCCFEPQADIGNNYDYGRFILNEKHVGYRDVYYYKEKYGVYKVTDQLDYNSYVNLYLLFKNPVATGFLPSQSD